MPERISYMLCILSILAGYGRHLAATIQRRAIRRGVSTIAQFFGTARLSVIRAHVSRGLMRAAALQRMPPQRAKRGRAWSSGRRADQFRRSPASSMTTA